MFKKAIATASLALAYACMPAAFAQGEVGPVKPAKPAAQVTPQEKGAGKVKRETEGSAAARQQPQGEVGPMKKAAPAGAGSTSNASRENRKDEARAANKAMNSASMPQRGEVGQTKAN